ncbi:HD-GYP domain-containing protein|uniref:Metal dependent phosphohydrolase n=1 Tax=Dendrosporobacter quercicolus TaxID=146817 RepID=A0A1G9R322_9FIRM|nr:HD-GYP domain-containing protein [Dendrosporobacter quercicolus]NSL48436.1 HD-GYP domain-containing protein [Dendrosporobacter quercicolus DSM 1736]SDM16835.1 metal dependent phosphohydrolase [Dendrosporobacter quercicolus]
MSSQSFLLDDLHQLVDALAAALDAKSSYTLGHSERVADLALLLARRIGLTEMDQQLIHIGAHLHDIGKIGVPDEVLNKPGRLTDEQFSMIKQHPVIGYHIVSKVSWFGGISGIVRHHHERFDGKGYPDGLAGTNIPLGARIVAVADAFDAMIAPRIYRKSFSPPEVLTEIIRCTGSQFDPAVVEALLAELNNESSWRNFNKLTMLG